MWDWSSRVVILPYIKKSAPNQHFGVKAWGKTQIFKFGWCVNIYVDDAVKFVS